MKIKDFFDIKMCKRVYKNQRGENLPIPFYTIKTLGGVAEDFISHELFDKLKNKYDYPNYGNVLISCSGTIGKTVKYNGEDSYFQDSNIMWLSPKKDNIDQDYIYYFLSNLSWNNLSTSTLKRLYKVDLLNLEIKYLPLHVQEKIGSFFKELDELIELYSNKIEKMNTSFMFIKKNIIKKCNDRFENVSLKDIATFINGKAHEKLVSENGSIKLINSKFIATNASVAKKVTKNICPTERGDICIVMSDVPNGKALAKCYIAHGDEAVNQRVCIIRSDKFLPEVLMLLLNRNKKYLMFDDHVSQTNLKKEDILNVNLPFIPLNIQSEIKQVLNEFDELLKEYNDLVNNYKCIKKYYLNKIFN